MTPETGPETSDVPPNRRGGTGLHCWLCPSKERLRPWARLAFAGFLNLVLAMWFMPRLGHVADPAHLPYNALSAFMQVLLPCLALLAVIPVFVSGRDVSRLLAVGLLFLPGYVFIVGCYNVFCFWLGGG